MAKSGGQDTLGDPDLENSQLILGSGSITIGFRSKFRADSRYPDPEISVPKPFQNIFAISSHLRLALAKIRIHKARAKDTHHDANWLWLWL